MTKIHLSQQEIYFDQMLDINSALYNIGTYIIIKGNLDVELFKASVKSAENTFDVFQFKNFSPNSPEVWLTEKPEGILIEEVDYPNDIYDDQALKEQLQERINQPFIINTDRLYDFFLIKRGNTEHWFYMGCHHLFSDGYGVPYIFLKYIFDKYHSLRIGDNKEFNSPSYIDLASESNNYLYSDSYKSDRKYWGERFGGIQSPLIRKRSDSKSYKTNSVQFPFNVNEQAKIRQFCIDSEIGLQDFLIAALTIYYNRTENPTYFDFCIPTHNRTSRKERNALGLFTKLIPNRIKLENQSLTELLNEIKVNQRQDYRHKQFPVSHFNKMLQELGNNSHPFDICVNYRYFRLDTEETELNLKGFKNDATYSKRAIEFSWCDFAENGNEDLFLEITFREDLFSEAEVHLLGERLLFIIDQLYTGFGKNISIFDILPRKEKNLLLKIFNDNEVKYPVGKTILDLFEEQVQLTPNSLAVESVGVKLTYQELNSQSNQLSHYLRHVYNIQPHDLIGIKQHRSEWMIISVLATLKADAAYVSIDPQYPRERIEFIEKDSTCKICIDGLIINEFKRVRPNYSNLKYENGFTKPDDMAYLIYTSGSTGKPKGVMITQSNVYSFIKWTHDEFAHSDFDQVLFTTSLNFDLSIFEIFHPLTTGKSLCILEDGLAIPKYLSTDKKLLINTVPSVVGSLLQQDVDFKSVHALNMAGEPIPANYKAELKGKIKEIRNLYGPSEDTTYSTIYRIDQDQRDLIGKPISNTQVFILNALNELQPVGVVGEICIGGSGLAKGYLNQVELTEEKFIKNPFKSKGRLYKTGDLGRWLPDGNIEFLGRKDDQVKIRGYRIELGEIEHALDAHLGSGKSIVLAKTNLAEEKELVAYVVAKKEQNVPALKTYLNKILPTYMVPAHFVRLDEMPLTPNGKVDKKALPELSDLKRENEHEYVAPTNQLQEQLVNIWKQILEKEHIGIQNDFFLSGGHSIKAVLLNNAYQKQFGVSFSLKELFEHTTISAHSELILASHNSSFLQIPALNETATGYAISDAQRRLWVLSQFEASSAAYNMYGSMPLKGHFELELFQKSFELLIKRHEILRTLFKEDDNNEIKQWVIPYSDLGFEIKYIDYCAEENGQKRVKEYIKYDANKTFDLTNGPLLRATLIKVNDDEFEFYFNMHHIIGDGWSLDILTKEVFTIYNALKDSQIADLSPLRIQYKDYSAWQLQQLEEDAFQTSKNYWLESLSGELPLLDLPSNKQRPKIKTNQGRELSAYIDAQTTLSLKKYVEENGGSLFIGLLSVWNVLMYRYTGLEDLIIGVPTAGRDHADLVNQIGFYVNTLALRNRIQRTDNFADFYSRVKENTLRSYSHQMYPFDRLVEELQLQRDISRSAVFDVILTLQNNLSNTDKSGAYEENINQIIDLGNIASKLDISIVFEKVGDILHLKLLYNSHVYEKQMAEGLIRHFKQLLVALLNNPNQPLSTVNYLSEIEESEILVNFNNTQVDFPNNKPVTALFEEQVIKTPNRVAVEFEGKSMTYLELNAASNQMANYLANNYKIGSDDLVAICQERSEWMMISILGVLKAGGAYVPIDPKSPKDRFDVISEDFKNKVLLDQKELKKFQKSQKKYSIEREGSNAKLNHLAYVIYTSGSTGKPKGVMLEHCGLTNRINWMREDLQVSENDVFLQKTPVIFDVSVWELFLPLVVGCKLVFAKPNGHKDPAYLEEIIVGQEVSIIHFVPSMLNSALENMDWNKVTSLRHVICSGEALSPKIEHSFREKAPFSKLHNYYGPTEASIDVTAIDLTATPSKGRYSSIGKPVANTQIYIVGENNSIQPIGVAGEILIGGVQVARGYLNREDLTNERFFESAFNIKKRVYRTGDLGKWNLDGTITYLGRLDDQVKIRGYRIEIGEIEYHMNKHIGVDNAIVLAKTDQYGEKSLSAYIVPSKKRAFTVHQILKTDTKELEFNADLYEMENGMSMYAYNRSEAQMLYTEVFEHKTYHKNGIKIPVNGTIVDIGANVGSFSIFSLLNFENVKIYAFEPLEPIFKLLQKNVYLYQGNIEIFNLGLSDKVEEADFDYYPYATILSGRPLEENNVKETVKRFIGNTQEPDTEKMSNEQMEELLNNRLIKKKYRCKLTTLSKVIKENAIGHIDLLKVDVENAEMDIINGIDPDDWGKISQVIIEVHDIDSRLSQIKERLIVNGFEVDVFQSEELEGTNLFNIYAIKAHDIIPTVSLTHKLEDNWFGKKALINSIKDELGKQLPDYMLPSSFALLNEIPLTTNGKVNRKALIAISDNIYGITSDYIAPRNQLEKQLVEVWRSILQRDKIGVKDDFFAHGGHSLTATKLIGKYHQAFEVKLTLDDIFKYTSIEAHAELITNAKKEKYVHIPALINGLKGTYNGLQMKGFPVSDAQRQLWVLSQFEQESAAYNIPGSIKLEGHYDLELLQKVFNYVIGRHEILRTVFKERIVESDDIKDPSETVLQWVINANEFKFKIDYKDLSNEKNPSELVKTFISDDAFQPFDLEFGPLLRVALLKTTEESYVLYLNMHHIISDAWSMEVLFKEIFACYWAYHEGYEPNLDPLPIQYKDYSTWQLEQLGEPSYELHKSYWLDHLKGELPILNLPTTKQRPRIKTNRGQALATSIDSKTTENLKRYVSQKGGSLFMGLLTSWNILMYRYTAQTDLVVGTPTAVREHPDLQNQIGYYINTLALRNQINPTQNFDSFYNKVKENTLKSYKHQMYPFDRLVEDLNIKRDTGRSVVFDVMLTLQNVGHSNSKLNKNIKPEQIDSNQIIDLGKTMSKFDIEIIFKEVGNELTLEVVFNPDIYEREMLIGLIQHFKALLSAALQDSQLEIAQLQYLSAEEKHNLLVTFNAHKIGHLNLKTITDLFEVQVANSPDNIAVIFGEKRFTYNEINQKSNQLAHYLSEQYNVQPDDIVAIKLGRSEWIIISILAVLKAGGAYLPIDPDYPQNRIEFIEHDSGYKLLIDEEELFTFKNQESNYSITPVKITVTPHNLAYVIYTSGSTGKPKGVMVEHQSIVNTIYAQIDAFGINNRSKGLQFASFSFDASISEIFIILAAGGQLAVISKEERADPESLISFLNQHEIDVATIPPSYLAKFEVEKIKGLTTLISAGEAANYQKAKEYIEFGTFYNAYGPTETSICGTVFKLDKATNLTSNNLPIGKPITDVIVYILDDNQQLQPIGAVGEIYIGGAGLARGYLNSPSLTREKFITNPFQEYGRLYKTGDLAKWLPDGNIEFIGRKDEQVKIRGYRIELGEIEHALLSNAQVTETVVLVTNNNRGEKILVAYLTADQPQTTGHLRSFLTDILPNYMLPEVFVQMDEFPLTTHGKIDKNALPNPEGLGLNSGVDYVAPRNKIEEKLVQIWEDILQLETVSVKDDFFSLGGQSLKVVRLNNKYQRDFEVKLTVNDLFVHSTLEAQATLISKASKTKYLPIPTVEKSKSYAISDAQRRLWILSQFDQGSVVYNLPSSIPLTKEKDIESFKKAIYATVERHEILRTVFKGKVDDFNKNGEIHQWILSLNDLNFEIKEEDYREHKNQQDLVENYIAEDSFKAFDLENGPLLRVALLQVGNEDYVFYFNMHHIISDGRSLDVLAKDIYRFYDLFKKNETQSFDPLRIQYKDYSAWQLAQIKEHSYNAHQAYWLNELGGKIPLLNLPTNKKRPQVKNYNGKEFGTFIDAETTASLKAYSKENGGSMFMLLLAGWNVLMYNYTSQREIVIGVPVAGREHPDLENQIGFYINVLALRNEVNPTENFEVFYERVKQKTLDSYEHQMYPFDRLVEELNLHRNTGRNPIFDISITYHSIDERSDIEINDKSDIDRIIAKGPSKVKSDIEVHFHELTEYISFRLIYDEEVYDGEMIGALMMHFKRTLKSLLNKPLIQICLVDYLTDDEKQALLFNFNDTSTNYSKNETLISLFEKQVKKTPNNIAIIVGDVQLSYNELNEKANQLANYLDDNYNIQPETLIGVQLNRSEWMIISILGILKTGAAYVPIDPEYPALRKEYIMQDSELSVLITESNFVFDIDYYDGDVFAIDVEFEPDNYNAKNLEKNIGVSNLAYIIYTSGSTGKPKGVMVEHQSIVNTVFAQIDSFQITSETKGLQMASFSFDASISETFIILAAGGCLSIAEEIHRKDPAKLVQLIRQNEIDIATISPSYLSKMDMNELKGLKKLITAGEPASAGKTIEYSKFGMYFNAYGPTETSVCGSTFTIEKESHFKGTNVPIGKPIANGQIYLLSENEQLQPIGVVGEICIGGAGLARGYLNQSELTKEKFVPNPFKVNERLYKTGDLGKWLPDGNIEFVGRKDDQVKIRGFRIELGEIEQALLAKDEITAAVVMVAENFSDFESESVEKELVGYVVADAEQNASELRTYLKVLLPEYMIPQSFVQLDEMPLTTHGKLDKKALQTTRVGNLKSGITYTAPQNEIEEKLVSIWEDILGKEKGQQGVDEGFFEAGGSSIKLISLKTRIEEELNTNCSIASLFQYTTIRMQAEMLTSDVAEFKAVDTLNVNSVFNSEGADTDIAVIGMSIKAPQSPNIFQFWENLRNGTECITHFTKDELSSVGTTIDDLNNENFVKANSYLDDKEFFDSSFFGYLPDEAMRMDPQTRIFHQVVWCALEDAGYDPYSYKGTIGLYCGAGSNLEWKAYNMLQNNTEMDVLMAEHLQDKDSLATLIAHKLNLKGSANSISTACSTSLVAIHHAVLSLLSGENTIAIAGGVSIKNKEKREGYIYQPGLILSKDGHNRTFDSEASGTVGSEGSGAVVLKKLSLAIADGDQIHAVIKGSAINNDGNRKVGYTAPSVDGQSEVIQMAQKAAGIHPESISYIEAHGTATKIGDPIEVHALNRVFGQSNEKYCALGSVKSNMGHLDAAAGVVGFIKTVLCLKHKELVPSLHFDKPNPEIHFEKSPFYVNTELKEWHNENGPLRAGVSSFGIGGTNAHIVLEESPVIKASSNNLALELIILSAKTENALLRQQHELKEHLVQNPNLNLPDVAWTLQNRSSFHFRSAFAASTVGELIEAIDILDTEKNQPNKTGLKKRKIAFMFSGQGAQYVNMGRDLYDNIGSVFSENMNHCLEIAKQYSKTDFKAILYPTQLSKDNSINETVNAQPILFMFEYSLAKQIEHYGFVPNMMIGHSIGEYVAACFGGVLTLDQALMLVIKRGELMQKLPKGSMLAVGKSANAVREYLSDTINLAVVNTPESCVLSGQTEAIEKLSERLANDGVAAKLLFTSHAFHSSMMDPILEEFTALATEIEVNTPSIPYISNVTGKFVTYKDLEKKTYWSQHIRKTVQFSSGIEDMLSKDNVVFIEIGPGMALCNFARQHFDKTNSGEAHQLVRQAKTTDRDDKFLLNKIANMWKSGLDVNWGNLNIEKFKQKISLPNYSFEQVRYPIAKGLNELLLNARLTQKYSKKPVIDDWFYERSWKRSRLLPTVPNENNIYLIFCDKADLGEGFISKIKTNAKTKVISVVQGNNFSLKDDFNYTLNPHDSDSYIELFKQLERTNSLPNKIIHFWNYTNERDEQLTLSYESVFEDLSLGYHSLVNIARSIGVICPFKKISMDIVTNEVYQVNTVDRINPTRAAILAPILTIPKEYKNVSCKQIDVELTQNPELVLEDLVQEIEAGYNQSIVAYRQGNRWIHYYEAVPLVANNNLSTKLKKGGVYLITGGTGGMGLAFSHSLAKEFKAKLILTGRRPMLEEIADSLKEIGQNIIYLDVDVADTEQMELKLSEAEKQFGKIDGIIHAAGIGDYGGIIQNRSANQCEQVFRSKIYGTISLEQIMRKRKVDFMVLCSAAAGFIAPFGQVAYTAANIFEDSFASAYKKNNIYSIGWDAWLESGMALAAVKELSEEEKYIHLNHAITNEEGCEVLKRILSHNIPTIAVFTRDIQMLTEGDFFEEQKKMQAPVVVLSRPELNNSYKEPSTVMEKAICDLFQNFFGIEEIGVSDDFFELGIDSLKAMTLAGHIHQKLNIELKINDVLENANIQDLAKKIEALQQFSQMQKEGSDTQYEHEIEI